MTGIEHKGMQKKGVGDKEQTGKMKLVTGGWVRCDQVSGSTIQGTHGSTEPGLSEGRQAEQKDTSLLMKGRIM